VFLSKPVHGHPLLVPQGFPLVVSQRRRYSLHATIERRNFWRTLKGLAGEDKEIIDTDAIAAQAKVINKL
jgi:hypothetical protein